MRALIVGLGSIGRRHLRILRSIEPGAHITVWRQRSTTKEEEGFADVTVQSEEAAIAAGADIAIIANPAPCHIATAIVLARNGVHLLIEKPLSDRLDGVDELLRVCRAQGLVLMVGYNLRFSESLIALRSAFLNGEIGRLLHVRAEVGQYLGDWRPGTDYRQSVSARADLGGGAVLELSHELDYLRWIGGEITSVNAWTGRLSDLDMDVEDTAEVLLTLENGVLGSVHLDMVQRVPVRFCRLIGSEGTLEWGGISNVARLLKPGESPRPLHGPISAERDAMYRAELLHFIDCVATRKAPIITGEDGRAIVELALAIKQSTREQRWINLRDRRNEIA